MEDSCLTKDQQTIIELTNQIDELKETITNLKNNCSQLLSDQMCSVIDAKFDLEREKKKSSKLLGKKIKLTKEISNLKNELKEAKKKDFSLCSICFDKKSNIATYPCRHLAMCSECHKKVKKCPICREKITGIVEMHLV